MVEVEILLCNGPTMSLLQLKEVIFNRYRELICTIPSACFGKLGSQETMTVSIHNSKGKNGSPNGHYNRTLEVKTKEQFKITKWNGYHEHAQFVYLDRVQG